MTMPPEPGQRVTGHPGGEPEDAGHDGSGADVGGYAMPAPRPAKSRLLQDGRDMFWSMAPLVLACVVLAGLLGMCSFAPTGPGPGPPPDYDAPAALQADADALRIPIRVPRVARRLARQLGQPQRDRGWAHRPGDRTTGACGQLDRGLPGADRHVPEPHAEQRRRGQTGRVARPRSGADRDCRTSTASPGSSTKAASATAGRPSRSGPHRCAARPDRRNLL